MKKIIFALLLGTMMVGCSTETAPDPTDDGSDNNNNYSPEFKFTFNGTTYTAASTTVTFGSKIFLTGLDDQGNLIIDMSLPVAKDQVASGKTFQIDYAEFQGNGTIYINNDPYALEGGSLNITKNENSRVSGNFSGTAYKMDYSQNPPAKGVSATISGGKFKDLGGN